MSLAKSSIHTLVTFRNSQGEIARGTLLKLDRSTVVFEVYNPYSILQLSEVLQELVIRRGDRKVYEGRAVVNNLVNTGLMLIVSAGLMDSWKDLLGVLSSKQQFRQEAERFVSDWHASNKIRIGYQLVVGEIQSLFSELSRWLQQLEIAGNGPAGEHDKQLSDEFFSELFEPMSDTAGKLMEAFEDEASKVPADDLTRHKAYVQKCVHPLIMRAPFPYRAFFKPLGYAGDYEMVNMMLRDPRQGPSTYAELVNTLYLATGPAQAHRNRVGILVDMLVKAAATAKQKSKPLRVLNVGCGPALELCRFLASDDVYPDSHFNLVDFNQETLDYTKSSLEEVLTGAKIVPRIDYTHMSVHSLLKSASPSSTSVQRETYDPIYCAGLFDYLSDRICTRLLRLFYQWTSQNDGAILVTNVHPANNALYLMEHILDWFLVYRDEKDMLALATDLSRSMYSAMKPASTCF